MALRWDPLLVRALADELNTRLAGQRLRAVRLDGDRRDLTLLFRDVTLTWPLHPTRGAPLLLDAGEPGPSDLPLPSKVRRVHAPPDERLLVFELLPVRRGGRREVVVELLGNQWNAFVTEGADARIRHVLVRRDGPRALRVGDAWTPPPPSGREGALAAIDLPRWREILEPVPPPQRAGTLVRSIAWTSSVNAPALVDADPDPERSLTRGHQAWLAMAHGNGRTAPCLLQLERGLQPYPWPLPGIEHQGAPSLLAAFRAWTDEASDGTAAGAVLPPELVAGLERRVDGALRRVTSLRAELEALEDDDALRARADLLLARFNEVPAGADQVTLEDFTGARVTFSLDPTLPVQDNARALYDHAAKVERARQRLPRLIEEATEAAEGLEALLARVRRGEAGIDDIRAAVPQTPGPGPTTGGAEATLPYRTYRSSGGLEIRVGKGARRNDDLTFHHAAPGDVWLHARHAAGAHVILRWEGPGNPPARDLHEAAVLAALNSQARTSGSVPVDWTLRKYVRKPRGAPAGSVVPQRVSTVFVEPDAGLADRLAAE